MARYKPFLYSLGLHLCLAGAAAWCYSVCRTSHSDKKTIAVSVLAYKPSSLPEPSEPSVRQKSAPVIAKSFGAIPVINLSKPAETEPMTPRKTQPEVPESPLIPIPDTVAARPLPEDVPVAKTPPSSQAVNHQKAYEDENLGRIRTLLAQNLTYPKNARRLNLQGEVTVTFSLSPNGEPIALTVTKSSGSELLDEAACRLIQTTAPQFPKPSKTVHISVPIGYRLR